MDTQIYMAPMSGITDLPFRLICRKLGAKHCFFEMIHCNALIYERTKSVRLLETLKKDRPVSAQLVGSDPGAMLEAAQKIVSLVDISSLDINSACPAKKIVRKGEGAALLKNRALLGRIIKKLSSTLPVPVTVKLRTGFHSRDVKECVKTANICQSNGASVVFIHGRTQLQGYSGDIDYESIRAVKKALKIPVFGSGNIFNPFMAKKMVGETGCDGITVARGALGNPWIFKNIESYLKAGKITKTPTLSAKKKILKEHLALIEKYSEIPDDTRIGIMGRVTTWYAKGLPNASKMRGLIFKTKSYEELLKLIKSVFVHSPNIY